MENPIGERMLAGARPFRRSAGHSLRTLRKALQWSWPPEDCGPDSRPSGIVTWGGGEQTYLCGVAAYYKTPLAAGRYRVVFPNMTHMNVRSDLTMEFEVVE